jgi:DNA-binding phage protein
VGGSLPGKKRLDTGLQHGEGPVMGKIKLGQILEQEDVMRLLRAEIERAGGQMPWAKMVGVNRAYLNKLLRLNKSPSKRVIKALKLRIVYAHEVNRRRKRA